MAPSGSSHKRLTAGQKIRWEVARRGFVFPSMR